MERLKLSLPVAVEGKYDKNTLKQIFDATVISLDGFGIFNSKEKQALLRRIGADGIILLTDSDGGGKQIRSFLNGILPKEKIFNAYVPKIEGKERRKKAPSKEGFLGVEGMSRDVLVHTLSPFIVSDGLVEKKQSKSAKMITKVDFFADGLSGGDNSSAKRARLCEAYGLPTDMTANGLLEALNLISCLEEYKEMLGKIG